MKSVAVGVLFGGKSSEYEVSLKSAASVLQNLDTDRFTVYKIGITKEGHQALFEGPVEEILSDTWAKSARPCVISPDPAHKGLLMLDGTGENIRLDVVFPVLHGKNGEDGTLQGLLELAELPYVGCEVLASAACMDKVTTHILLSHAGILSADFLWTTRSGYQTDPDSFCRDVAEKLGFPCFVKPANAGSSVGITKVYTAQELPHAMEVAFKEDGKVLVEAMQVGRELECAVLGNQNPVSSVPGEILSCNDFYDYDAKYLAGKTETGLADLPKGEIRRLQETAVAAYRTMGCRGLSRVDFFYTEDGRIIVNEINTLPGFTSISMYPQLMMASGYSYSDLLTALIELALEER